MKRRARTDSHKRVVLGTASTCPISSACLAHLDARGTGSHAAPGAPQPLSHGRLAPSPPLRHASAAGGTTTTRTQCPPVRTRALGGLLRPSNRSHPSSRLLRSWIASLRRGARQLTASTRRRITVRTTMWSTQHARATFSAQPPLNSHSSRTAQSPRPSSGSAAQACTRRLRQRGRAPSGGKPQHSLRLRAAPVGRRRTHRLRPTWTLWRRLVRCSSLPTPAATSGAYGGVRLLPEAIRLGGRLGTPRRWALSAAQPRSCTRRARARRGMLARGRSTRPPTAPLAGSSPQGSTFRRMCGCEQRSRRRELAENGALQHVSRGVWCAACERRRNCMSMVVCSSGFGRLSFSERRTERGPRGIISLPLFSAHTRKCGGQHRSTMPA